jgi:PleD family two-component response regulator
VPSPVAPRLHLSPATARSNDKGAAKGGSDARRIVIVEDDDFVREGMEMMLQVAGYRLRATGSGHAALRWLADDPDMLAMPRLLKPFSLGDLFSAATRALETQGHVGV